MDEKAYKPDESAEVSPKTVGVFIDGSYFSGVQDCQALFIPSSSHIPDATRQIYFNLSAAKNRMRRGNPDLLLALVATGNSFSFEASEKLTRGICRLVKRCCLWVVTSGERSDPLAVAVASAVQSTLPQTDNYDEPLILAVNHASVACKGNGLFAGVEERTAPMTDAHENTLFLLFNETAAKQLSLLQLRTLTAIALATPPPALPLSPEMLSFIERSPLPAVLFCGASLESLSELVQFVENGIASIIVQDASSLCKLLKSAFTLYSTNSFDNERFSTWLSYELRNTASATASDELLATPRRSIAQILSTAFGTQTLVYFTPLDSLENLPQKLLDVFAKSNRDSGALRRILHLAVKLDQASAIRAMNIKSLFTEEQITQIVERALAGDGKINALSALLDQNITPHVNPPVLMRWYRRTCDKHFFNAIILAHCLGRGRVHETVDAHLAHQLNELLVRLSGGVAELFPPDFIFSPAGSQDRGKALQVLAVWALLLNRTELARCLAAYVPDPIAFSLILAKTARGLAHETHGWFFYEERLLTLSKDLSTTSVALLDAAYEEAPEEAYISLCNPLEAHHGMTLTQMAYEMTAKDFIAHECCQRWVLRLLYGDMHLRNLLPYFHLPNWLKTVLGAVFVFPAVLWVTAKSSSMRGLSSSQRRNSKNGATSRNAGASPWPIKNGPKPKTNLLTKSHELEMDNRSFYVNESKLELLRDSVSISDSELDDTEAPFIKKFATTLVHQGMRPVKETLRTADKLQLFYSTPITKYWLSLVLRLLYLLLFAISISLPHCGSMFTDVALWLWSFCWLLEALFVARIRLRYSHWQQMPWTMFDISCVASFLFVFLANHFTTVTWHHALMTAYTRKSVWAAFLLYQCYSTLFVYVPLSDLFGPLLVRLKLMITRDFVNFLVLISLFVFSSSIAIKAVIFPDRQYSLLALGESVYWGWLQLFTTDMSMLSQSEHCRNVSLGERDFCEQIGGYADATCPTQSAMGFFTVFEFFVILKLISFPILYALFARTAKVVEDEATSIWKFQMYNLATEFSLRPFLPPPLTPLFLAGLVLLRLFGCISGVFYRAACAPAEHPDVLAAKETDEVDQNKPKGAGTGRQHYWTQLAVNYWKAKFCATTSGCKCSVPDDVADKLNSLSIVNSYATAKKPMWTIAAGADARRLSVDAELRPWTVLVPDYRPPSYSKPKEKFPQFLLSEVEDLAQQPMSDFGKQWRQRKLSDVLDSSGHYGFSLCNIGLPLNPAGRTGLAGRGNFPKFGPNREMLAVVIWEASDRKIKVLATSSGVLPSEWQYGSANVTDFLLRILEEVGVTVIDVRSLSNDGRLPVHDVHESVAHVSIGPLPSDEETDNAWREADVWSIDLTGMDVVKATVDNYEWTAPDSPQLSAASKTFVQSALRMFNL